MKIAVLVISAYLIGSIPFSIIITRLFSRGKADITASGTGNPGTENAWIIGGWVAGLTTAILDMTKGIVPILLATPLLGWTLTDNTFAILMLSIPAWVGHCFPVWLKFRGGMGNGVVFGTRLYVGGPVIWCMAQIFLFPNLLIRNRHKKVAFNHVMALGVNLISAGLFLMLHYVDMGYFQWGLFHLIGQPVGDYLAVFHVNLIWVALYIIRRLMLCNLITDIRNGIPLWRSLWLRGVYEAFPENTTYEFPDEKFKLVDSMIWRDESA